MSIRTGHGAGAGRPHVEVMPVDELPKGQLAPHIPPPPRDGNGRFVGGDAIRETAREAGRKGGRAKAMRAQLDKLIGLQRLPEDHAMSKYVKFARQWRDGVMADLAATVGGGQVGPGPASIVAAAARQLAASMWLHDEGSLNCNAKMITDASKMSNDSRQNVLAAFELCAKEANARAAAGAALFSIDQARADFQRRLAETTPKQE